MNLTARGLPTAVALIATLVLLGRRLKGGPHRVGVGRAVLVVVVLVVLAVGAVSVLYLPGVLSPKKTEIAGVVIPPTGTNNLDESFSPRNITVVIGVNNTVRWTNEDPLSSPHTITEGKPVLMPITQNSCIVPVKGTLGPTYCPSTTPLFDSGDVPQNGTFTFTFSSPGVYEYFCIYHPFQIGYVTVKQ